LHTYFVGSSEYGSALVQNGQGNYIKKAAVPTENEIIKGIKAPGRFDATVASEAEARRLVQTALPHATEVPPAVPGAYPKPAPGVKAWFQVQPAEPSAGNDLPHVKYEDWTGGKKRTGGSWGHIFFPPSPGS
jgi:hypothetical protein